MKLYLGCGPGGVHDQHKKIMGDTEEWTFVDLYIKEPYIKNWDCKTLEEVEDNSVEHIYASHLLEHFPHTELLNILDVWQKRLKTGGKLTLNVPDLVWASKHMIDFIEGKVTRQNNYYHDFSGERGILNIFYGSQSHEGEYHYSGFYKEYLEELLKKAGYIDIKVRNEYDAHDMGVLIASARKA